MFKSIIAAITALFIASTTASAQNEFTYQGTIDVAGVPANGLYDMQFRLYNDPTAIATLEFDEALGVTVTDGLFSAEVDFGFSNYSSSVVQYIEIRVRQTGGGGGYTTLSPRQQLTASPRAVFANRAAIANSLDLPLFIDDNYVGTSLYIYNSHPTGTGIFGHGNDIGIKGDSNSGTGGSFSSASDANFAVALQGTITRLTPGLFSAAIHGENKGTGSLGIGVWGSHDGSGWGVYGSSVSGFAGRFAGDVAITGTLSKSGGSFKIDHPQDPENMFLSHSFVESPDMKNIYDGVVILNKQGQAIISLPSYFNALNQDFRYQLTTIGAYAPVFIATEIESSPNAQQFTIAGGTPNLKVSWQVTGIRHDAWANQNRIPIEEFKSDSQKGKFLNPESFNQPKELGLGYIQSP